MKKIIHWIRHRFFKGFDYGDSSDGQPPFVKPVDLKKIYGLELSTIFNPITINKG